MKFRLQNTLPQAICRDNTRVPPPKAGFPRWRNKRTRPSEREMPEIRIVTEVAGRVCALPVSVGTSVGDGDEVALVEAMKMEIPVASPAAGKLTSMLVRIDDVVAEGQVVAIIET